MTEKERALLREAIQYQASESCPPYAELEAYRLGQGSASTRAAIDAHLQDCLSCFGRLTELKTWAYWEETTEAPSPALGEKIHTFIETAGRQNHAGPWETLREKLKTWWNTPWVLGPAFAGIVAAFFILRTLLPGPDDSVQQQVEAILQARRESGVAKGWEDVALFHQARRAAVVVVSESSVQAAGTPLPVGIIVDRRGWVLTYAHATADAREIVVVFDPQLTAPGSFLDRPKGSFTARVFKVDRDSDLALLQLDDPPAELVSIELGSLKEITAGTKVFTFARLPAGGWAARDAAVLGVIADYEWTTALATQRHRSTVIQTQTPDSQPWRFPGVLLDSQGKLIGLNVDRNNDDINSALAIDVIQAFLLP